MSRRAAPQNRKQASASSQQTAQSRRQPAPAAVASKSLAQQRAQRDANGPSSVVADFVDETDMRKHEALGCIMFASPGPSMIQEFKEQVSVEVDVPVAVVDRVVTAYQKREHPKRAVKYVGGYATEQECKARVAQIEDDEPMFHIWTVENGKWLVFDPSPELVENEEFRESELNELMKSKKLNAQHTKDFYRQEMRKRVERARLEGTKEGQEILMQAEEPYQAVEHRVKAATDGIKEMQDKIIELEKTKALAERKLERMQQDGRIVPATDVQVKDKMDDLASRTVIDTSRQEEVKTMLAQAQTIEKSRKRDVSNADVAKYAAAKQAVQSEPAQLEAPVPTQVEEVKGMFDETPFLGSAASKTEN